MYALRSSTKRRRRRSAGRPRPPRNRRRPLRRWVAPPEPPGLPVLRAPPARELTGPYRHGVLRNVTTIDTDVRLWRRVHMDLVRYAGCVCRPSC
ncbi:putative leader peptide [Streptomyces sp. HmicA12]|uniref:putative leader peptide n=1 Tax=Streptomyces sp. HmicA12 TaxID=1156844 RepID=UPI003B63B0AA